jgi:hypothetical protein
LTPAASSSGKEDPISLDVGGGLAVDTGRATVGAH